MNIIRFADDDLEETASRTGLTVEQVQAKIDEAWKHNEVLYLTLDGDFMPIKSWMCDGNKRRPGCKEPQGPHSRHSIWENAK